MVTAFFSGLLGGIISWFFSDLFSKYYTTSGLTLECEPRHIAFIQLKTRNTSSFSVKSATLYLTLNHNPEDKVDFNEQDYRVHAFNPAKEGQESINPRTIREDLLHWDRAGKDGANNPMTVDIQAGGTQSFALTAILQIMDKSGYSDDSLIIPCEEEFPKGGIHLRSPDDDTPERNIRAILRKKDYKGIIAIVSDSTFKCEWPIEFNLKNSERPVVVGRKKTYWPQILPDL